VPAFDYGLFAAALAEANRAVLHDLRPERPAGSNFKCKEPMPWEGKTESWDSWLQDCNMAFELRARDFAEDRAKVMFTGGYLKEGSAVRNWYLLANRMPERPRYLDNWTFFVEEIRSRFLPRDRSDRALEELTQLKMKPGERIAEFNNKFQLWVLEANMSDYVDLIARWYRTALPGRISIPLSNHPVDWTTLDLYALMAHAQEIDLLYWQNRDCDPGQGNFPLSNQPAQPRPASRAPTQPPSTSHAASAAPSSTTATSVPDKAKADTKSEPKINRGPLLEQERQRRQDQGLCLYCGGKGHMVSQCPSLQGKARKADTESCDTPAEQTTALNT